MKKKIIFLHASLFALLSAFTVKPSEAHAQQPQKVVQVNDATFDLLKQVKGLSGNNTSILLTITTHQDLAWIKSIEKSTIDRDTLWLTPFLKRLNTSPGFQMDLEQSSVLHEYIRRHPEAKDTLTKYMHEGRILVGAAYTQAYEEMYSGESLARQFYFGKKWLRDNFDGYNATVYYNSDVPGRTLQMPQLMSKAGVKGMFFSRFERGVFDWYSPDGSFITAYSPGHYIDFYNVLAKNDTAALAAMAQQVLYWLTNFNNKPNTPKVVPAVLNYEFGWNQQPVHNLYPFTSFWNGITAVENTKGERLEITLPAFRFATFDEFINGISASSNIPRIAGERPNEWIYIHGPSHHWALSASREADILLPAAEKFWTSDLLVDKNAIYPENEFQQAWASKIYPDHGWGGKDGQMTDDIFLAKFEDAKAKGTALLDEATTRLSGMIKTQPDKGIPIVIFNSLSWKQTGPVSVNLPLTSKGGEIAIFDGTGKPIPSQLSDARRDKNGNILSATLTFIATDIPPVGYETYYARPASGNDPSGMQDFHNEFDNRFYRLHFANGGLDEIFDKSLQQNIVPSTGLKAGEIFTLASVGNGAGEFDAIQQPSMEGFDKTGNYNTKWELVESGNVYAVFKFRQPIAHAVVEETVKVYNTIKRIDFNVALKNWDGTLYREYRMALPLDIAHPEISYEVPYGKVTEGQDELKQPAGQIYMTPPKDIHPRGLQNWMNASGTKWGATLSSSVAAFDFMDPTGLAADVALLQPILLASRRSCHGEGNEYLQTGDHYYSFSLTSGNPGCNESVAFGRGVNEPLKAVVNPIRAAAAPLGEKGSFVSVNKSNVIITAMKKAEDDDAVILRFFETEGTDTDVEFAFSRPIKKVFRASLIEERQDEIPSNGNRFSFHIKHNSVETIKVYFN